MFRHSFSKWIANAILFSILTVIFFFGLKLFSVDPGNLILWISGVAFYWVLSGITILPWNVHFAADDTIEEIRISKENKLKIDETREKYANKIYRKSLVIAILIHLLVSFGFCLIALYTQIGMIAYIAAGAALGLTIIRPSIRACEHAVNRLKEIKENCKYPREDLNELLNRVKKLEKYDKRSDELEIMFKNVSKDLGKAHDEVKDKLRKYDEHFEEIKRYIDQKISTISSATELVTAIETFEKQGIKSISLSDKK